MEDQKIGEDKEKLTGISAVIFDMDGLMIDSEPVHCQAFHQVLQKFGHGLTEEENAKRYVGIADIDIANDLIGRYGLSIAADELVKQKREAYGNLLGQQVVPQAGLVDLLTGLKDSGLKVAVASSSAIKEIETVIDALNIRSMIDQYCSADQVEKGKPAPDLFLFAAEKLNTPPSQCLILEDAPSGIEAANAAGMYSFAVPSRETADKDFSNATRKLNSLAEVVSNLG